MSSYMQMVRDLAQLLSPKELAQAGLVLILAVLMSLVEAVGVASILPFLAVLGDPELIQTNALLNWLYIHGGFSEAQGFLVALGALAFLVTLFAAVFRAAAQFAIFHFSNMRMHSIGMRMMEAYLSQPYSFFLGRNTSDIGKRVLSDVQLAVEHSLLPALQLFSSAITVLFLAAIVMIVDPATAMLVILVVCGVYGVVYFGGKKKVDEFGDARNRANLERFTVASEAFGGIREIKQYGRERAYLSRFASPSKTFSQTKTFRDNFSYLPKYIVEVVAFGGAIAITLILLNSGRDLGSVLPILGLYAFAGYRILPAVQLVHAGLTRLRFGRPVVDSLASDLRALRGTAPRPAAGETEIVLRDAIRFLDVSFGYNGTSIPAVEGLNLEINAKTTVGIVGATGSGKTTVVDLLAGLLVPTAGRIMIDDQELSDRNRAAWMRKIGYVPQQMYLADASIAENIAFGIRGEKIDDTAVARAAQAANLHQFVSQLPLGYQTIVGERGVRLSGGQRQRVSIARALYQNPAILILDEATSALDNVTEVDVLRSMLELRHDRTMIIIAHRLSTVRACDQIILLENGRAVRTGRYEELFSQSATFRRLAGDMAATR